MKNTTLLFQPLKTEAEEHGTATNGSPKVSVPEDKLAVFKHDPANRRKRNIGKGTDALYHHLADSPLIQMANQRQRALQERQTNHLVSNGRSVTRKRLASQNTPFAEKDSVKKGTPKMMRMSTTKNENDIMHLCRDDSSDSTQKAGESPREWTPRGRLSATLRNQLFTEKTKDKSDQQTFERSKKDEVNAQEL